MTSATKRICLRGQPRCSSSGLHRRLSLRTCYVVRMSRSRGPVLFFKGRFPFALDFPNPPMFLSGALSGALPVVLLHGGGHEN